MSTKLLYIGNLPYQTTNEDLQKLFSAHGTVVSAEVRANMRTGRSRGFGFVEMSTPEEAQAAVTALHLQEYGGRALTVNVSRPRASARTSHDTGWGGWGGGGGNWGGGGGRGRY